MGLLGGYGELEYVNLGGLVVIYKVLFGNEVRVIKVYNLVFFIGDGVVVEKRWFVL